MSGSSSPVTMLVTVATLAAAWQAVRSSPNAAAWLSRSWAPLLMAAREGHLPSTAERRRLVAISVAAAVVAGWLLFGPALALALALAAPAAIASWIRRARRRYVRQVSRGLPEVATALADGLSAGRSVRGALEAVPGSIEGPAGVEMAKVAADLGLGMPTDEALLGLGSRIGTRRAEAFCVALLSQRLAGGDLAGLMRRFAQGAAESDRVADDARAATAQARFTGWLVVSMPAGAAALAQLVSPGFAGSILGSGPATAILLVALAMQVGGFLMISRLARVAE